MAIQKTEAIVIDRRDYSNTSLIVTFYTHQFGQLSGLAKGARRPKSPFLGTFDLLNHNEILFYRHTRSSLHTLSHSEVKNGFPGIRESEQRTYAGTYVAELVKGMTREDEPHPEAFDLLVNTLRELSRAQDTDRVVFQFEIKFLGTVGYQPEIEYCVSCRAQPKSAQIPFCVSEGGILCQRCASGREAEVQLTSPGALATLRALRRKSLPEGASVKFTPAVARDIKRLLRPHIVYRMEKEPRSMKFI
jgi:DNA repair protein RecO (recombination protein O)